MTADFFNTQLVAYLSLRQALGFQTQAEKVLLPELVAFVNTQESTGPIRAQIALEWACPRRPKPFIFTPTQITTLLEGAQASRPRRSLRPHTLACLLGLLASTGVASRRSHPLTDQSGHTGARSAAITHPGNQVP